MEVQGSAIVEAARAGEAPGGRWRDPADPEGGGSSGWPWVVRLGCMRNRANWLLW